MVLPRYDSRSEAADEAAEYGTLAHWWKETGETRPEWASERDSKLLEAKIALSGTNRNNWWRPGNGEHEVSFAIRLHDAHLELFHGLRTEAEAWKAKFDRRLYLTGTIDWVFWGADGNPAWVDDLKTGKWPVSPTSRQLRSYALVPWIKAGMPPSYDVNVSITGWPKYPKWKGPKREWHSLTALDLAEHLDDLRHAATHPEEANPESIYIGPFDPERKLSVCAFCPCRKPFPHSEWMGYRYRAEQHCDLGLIKRLRVEREAALRTP